MIPVQPNNLKINPRENKLKSNFKTLTWLKEQKGITFNFLAFKD
jgi:hypothetical protein